MDEEMLTVVRVRVAWSAWQTADVRVDDLRDLHWLQPGGAPRPMVHAFISCADIAAGALPHDCVSSQAPHRIRVCVLKHDVTAALYRRLAAEADAAGAA